MPRSVNDARFQMWATVVPRLETPNSNGIDTHTASDKGSYEIQSDPDSGEPITVWVPADPATITADSPAARYDIRCYARGYTNLGFRSSGNRETFFHGQYEQIEAVQFDYSKSVRLNHQSFITNIRLTQATDDPAQFLWLNAETNKPLVWEIQGITPVVDPFGKPLRFTTVLRRALIQ